MPARDTLQSRGEWRVGFFLNGQQPRAPSLRDLLAGPEPIVAPGAYDALSARLIEAAGFRAAQQPAGPNEELNGKHIYQVQRE
jgi:hypothetical protein